MVFCEFADCLADRRQRGTRPEHGADPARTQRRQVTIRNNPSYDDRHVDVQGIEFPP